MIPEEQDFTIIYAARYRGIYDKQIPHHHQLYQLCLLCSDRLELFTGDDIIHCDHTKEVMLIKPGDDHVLRLREDNTDQSWLARGINCALDCKFSVNSERLNSRLNELPMLIPVGDTSSLIRLSSLMLDSLSADDDCGRQTAYSAFASLLGLIINSAGGGKRYRADYDISQDEPYFFSSNHKHTADTEGLDTVKRYIDLHYREKITLEELIQLSCINRTALNTKFKRSYGFSPIDYVINKRIEEAKLLLAETALEINELSERVGFSSASYFSRIFRRYTGMSPNEYRRQGFVKMQSHNNI